MAVEVQGGGGRKRGIRGGIVHVDGKEGDVGKGGGEKEGCDVTVADMLNGNSFGFRREGNCGGQDVLYVAEDVGINNQVRGTVRLCTECVTCEVA